MHRGLVLALLLAVTSPLLAANFGDFDVAPPPSWVELASVDPTIAAPASQVRFGLFDLLSDHQVRVSGEGVTHYYRVARRVLTSSGVQNASELSIDFDPSYERLVLHEVRLQRNGVRMATLNPDAIRIIEKEEESADRIYDGRLTALIFLDDVRPGDVIDYSWSAIGANPLLGGRYVDELDFSPAVPTALLRHRVLTPAERPLHHRLSSGKLDPTTTIANGERVTVWQARNVEPLEIDDDIPSWYQPWRTVQISEFASWAEVAAWADELFVADASDLAAIAPLLAQLRRDHATAEAQALAATRFVQDEIRYLGIEMGRNSHEPRAPRETLSQRWGDCKDKTLLLVTILRELGFDAYPAMVNTKLRRLLDRRLPSPFEFDHVIVQLRAGGETIWIDPTLANQGGTLRTIDTPVDERALIVAPSTRSLTTVERSSRAAVTVAESYQLQEGDRASLEIITRYEGGEADVMRSTLATISPRDFARDRLNAVAASHPRISPIGVPLISDHRDANRIVVTERYSIRELRAAGAWFHRPRELDPWLTTPSTIVRTMPLAIEHPVSVRQTVTIHFDSAPDVPQAGEVIETPALRFRSSVDRNGDTVVLDYQLVSTSDAVEPDEVARHVSGIRTIRRSMTVEVPGSEPALASMTPSRLRSGIGWKTTLFAALATLVAICCLIVLPRRKSAATAAETTRSGFHPGEAPSSAIVIRDVDEVALRSPLVVCQCGARTSSGGDLQRARYADGEMLILSRNCSACGSEHSLYFTLGASDPDSARSA